MESNNASYFKRFFLIVGLIIGILFGIAFGSYSVEQAVNLFTELTN